MGDNTIKIRGLNADAVTNATIESMGRALADGDLVVIKTAGNKAVDVRPLGSNAVQQLPEDSILFKAEGVGHDGKNLIYTRLPKETLESTKLNEADEAGRLAAQAGKEGGEVEGIYDSMNGAAEGAGTADKIAVDGSKTKFSYKNNPMDNPKAAKDIIENPNAVYGYSPNPGSTRIGPFVNQIDWSDPKQVEIATRSRVAYHQKNQQMLDSLYNQGYSTEEIARKIVNERNVDRLNSYLERGDMKGYEIVRKSNLDTYRNADGPTPEFLLEKYGSWEGVIKAALRGNPGMDACVGLYDLYYGGK